MTTRLFAAFVLALSSACSTTEQPCCDAGRPDVGVDAPSDAGVDAPSDAGRDAPAPDPSVIIDAPSSRHPSIAIDGEGTPHVSVLVETYELRYARLGAGGWEVETIGVPDENESIAAIAVDASDRPAVAFQSNYAIRLTRWTGTSWTLEDVFRSAEGYGPTIGVHSLAIDPGGVLHVVSNQEANEGGRFHSWIRRFSDAGGTWSATTVEEYANERVSRPSIALDGDRLEISWVSYLMGRLHHATSTSTGFAPAVASEEGACCDDSFVAVGAGRVDVAFASPERTLSLAERDAAWSVRPLRDDGPDGALGTPASLAVTSRGALRYVYLTVDGRLVHVADGAHTIVADDVTYAAMALDADDRAHVVYTTDVGVRYARLPAP